MNFNTQKLISLVPTNHPHLFRVKLTLDLKTRNIGTLNTLGEGKFLTDRKKEHVFQKTNSLGITEELMISPDIHFKWIIINYEGIKLITTRVFFLNHSKVFVFTGYEKQYFLPLEEFGIEKAMKYQNCINQQFTLFEEEIK